MISKILSETRGTSSELCLYKVIVETQRYLNAWGGKERKQLKDCGLLKITPGPYGTCHVQ